MSHTTSKLQTISAIIGIAASIAPLGYFLYEKQKPEKPDYSEYISKNSFPESENTISPPPLTPAPLPAPKVEIKPEPPAIVYSPPPPPAPIVTPAPPPTQNTGVDTTKNPNINLSTNPNLTPPINLSKQDIKQEQKTEQKIEPRANSQLERANNSSNGSGTLVASSNRDPTVNIQNSKIPQQANPDLPVDLINSFIQDSKDSLSKLQFDTAKTYAESARRLDPNNPQIARLIQNIKSTELKYMQEETVIK